MKKITKVSALFTAAALAFAAVTVPGIASDSNASASFTDARDTMEYGTLTIGGAGFVSGIVTGQKEMYLRTDVGGAYRFDYDAKKWVQLFGFLTEADRGLLSVKGIAIDPTDDNTVYFLCGCAYFSDARTVIFKTTDGGQTFTEYDVTEHIQVHGNGDGRECIEPIAVDPDDPNTIYAGGDVTAGKSALIKSTDGGATWNPVMGYDELGLFPGELKYPMWTNNMVRGTEPSKEYNQQNGIGCILIEDGKVYVGTSVTGQANVHVASVKDDKFEPIEALPNANYPLSITSDHNGNLFFTYIAGLAFSGSAGGAYKYDKKTGAVEQLSVSNAAIGMIEADRNDPNKLFARTCGTWSDQWWGAEWTQDDPNTPENESSIAWGDHFFRSADGGKTWEDITPGAHTTDYSTSPATNVFSSLPLQTGGYAWVDKKACHWGSGILIDPRDPEGDRILLTSGNGVFACDNAWAEKDIQFYFQPDGVEECVSLDFVSVPGGANFSAIGDYDGFVHLDPNEIPEQYKPNMGSTCAIAYCPQNPDVLIRIAEGDGNNTATGYYSMDGGKSWTGMKCSSGGKAAITELGEGKYRFLKSAKEGGAVQYSDDFGKTWSDASGISGYKPSYMLVDPEDPSLIYASGIIYNQYWGSNPNVKEPSFDECHYSMFVSHDYGKTWTENPVCKYDMCDATGDPAYISSDKIAFAAGWNGLYIITDEGTKAEKTDVFYCKTIGYGAPEKEGGPNTLYIYGRPEENDPEGVYRSTDAGQSWVLINTEHLYGGTGNGNYLCGDMNTFGTVYMSTVGCGIVYMSIGNGTVKPPVSTTTKPATTTSTTTTTTEEPVSSATTTTTTKAGTTEVPASTTPAQDTTTSTTMTTASVVTTTSTTTTTVSKTTSGKPLDVLYGDTNLDGSISMVDVVYLNKYNAGSLKFNDQQMANADCLFDNVINSADSTALLKYTVKKLDTLPVIPE